MKYGWSAVIRFVVFLLTVFCCSDIFSQTSATGNDYYRSQYVKLHKAYLKDTNDVDVLVRLSQFYSDEGNPMSSLPFAKQYIDRADSRFRLMLSGNDHDKELRRLITKGVTLQSLAEQKKRISNLAVKRLEGGELSIVEVDQFLTFFPDDKTVVRLAGIQRVKAAYRSALRQNTIESYVSFIKQYPGTDEAQNAEKHISILVDSLFDAHQDAGNVGDYLKDYRGNPEVLRAVERRQSESAYRQACQTNTIEAYRQFVETYPSSPRSVVVVQRIDSLRTAVYEKLHTANEYAEFALNNSDCELADRAVDELYRMVVQENDVQAARLFIKHFDHEPRYADVYKHYYGLYAQDGSYQLIELFSQNNPDYPFRSAVSDDLNEAADIEAVNLMERYDESRSWNYKELIKTFHGNRIAYVALQRLLQPSIVSNDWTAAVEACQKFEGRFQGYNKESYTTLVSLLNAPYDNAKMPAAVALDGNVSSFAVSPSGTTAYYTLSSDSMGLYTATIKGNRMTAVSRMTVEGAPALFKVFSIFDAGKKMILGADGDLLIAVLKDRQWRVAEIPSYPVNTDYIETDGFMLPDGSGMILASDRPSGYNVQPSGMAYHGDTALATDIYFVPLTSRGWGNPVNLGFRVNSCYSERYPVLSSDFKTLYFVSDRGGALGYGDIFVSHRTSADDWSSWSQPHNLGKEVNSAFAEGTLSITADGRVLYYSSPRDGVHTKVFAANLASSVGGGYAVFKISDFQGDLVACRLFDSQTGSEVRIDNDGESYTARLSIGRTYVVSLMQKSRWQPLFDIEGGAKTNVPMGGYAPDELAGRVVQLPHLSSVNPADELTPIAEAEIEQLSLFLVKNASLAVDIVVDSPGSDASKCYSSSLYKANQIKQRMLAAGVGVERVSAIGRGNLEGKSGDRTSVSVRFRLQ